MNRMTHACEKSLHFPSTLYAVGNRGCIKSEYVPKFHVSVLISPCVVPCRLGGVRLLMYAVRDEYIIPYVKP